MIQVIHNDWTTGETEKLKIAASRGWSLNAIAEIVGRPKDECERKLGRLIEQGFLIPNGERCVIK